MRATLCLIAVTLWLVPASAGAHATPVSYDPASSASLTAAPEQLTVRFSERLEDKASALRIEGPEGIVSEGNARVAKNDARLLSVHLPVLEKGTYKVTWSVVSADDGHFTRGSYFFAIGEPVASSSVAEGFQLVTRTTTAEAVAMSIELAGNGLLWAALLVWVLVVRVLVPRFGNERPLLERLWSGFFIGGSLLIVSGAVLQVWIKSLDLSSLNGTSFLKSFPVYVGTAAGEATLWRLAAGILFLALALFFRRKIFRAARFTPYEGAMLAALGMFAYFRAIISHATANPFHPELSITVNFLHVIEKDFWAGMAGIALVLVLLPRLRAFLKAVIGRMFVMMAASGAALGATAAYIVWLHLKEFGNLFTTTWGEAFVPLGLLAAILVVLRTVQVLLRLRAPRHFARYLAALLSLEFVVALLVIYASSVVILTSPPLPQPSVAQFSVRAEGLSIALERSRTEDGMLLLTAGVQEPLATLGGATVELQPRFPGGYVFPAALLSTERQTLDIDAPQEGRYDAKASFEVSTKDFEAPEDWEAHRPLDGFTWFMIGIALASIAYSVGLARLSAKEAPFEMLGRGTGKGAGAGTAAGVALAFLVFGALPWSGFLNPFKAQCEADANMWHLMLPTKAGIATSQTPQEGCMWGMGNYLYMFSDAREYAYYRSLGDAKVELGLPSRIKAGIPVDFSFSLKDKDGAPAQLFVDMEKLAHLVIVSADQSEFAHIHAAETPAEKASSVYHFRHVFPKAGEYLLSLDYAHGVSLESRQFKVTVEDGPAQGEVLQYPNEGVFGGYRVSLKYPLLIAGEPQLLRYSFSKDGRPVENLETYLSAAMHVAIVKNDFTSFIHTHGEVHASGTPPLPVRVVNGKIAHNMEAMLSMPPRFGPDVEAHVIFPTPGLYTVWGEFNVGGTVIPSAFTVRVEE